MNLVLSVAVAILVQLTGLSREEAAVLPLEPSAPERVEGQPFIVKTTTDGLGRTITYYLSDTGDESASLPLAVFVQGSGGGSHFARLDDGRVAAVTGSSAPLRALETADGRPRARLLLVEKPGVALFSQPERPGSAIGTTDEFRREHTPGRWATALSAAIDAVEATGAADVAAGVCVMGHSEGGLSAAALAARDARVSHLAVLAGGGPTQLVGLLELARTGDAFGSLGDTPAQREAAFIEAWQDVMQDPENAGAMFLGHPNRRWSSFCATSTAAEALRSDARVYIAQGGRDTSSPASNAEVLRGELLARGRDVTLFRLPKSDHGFRETSPDGERVNRWGEVFQRVADWWLGDSADD